MLFCAGVAAGLAASVSARKSVNNTPFPPPHRGICVMKNGYVMLRRVGKRTEFECNLKGLEEGYHGMHVHRSGDLREGCDSTCSHYNPDKSVHGGPFGRRRHRGDIGNILVRGDGVCVDKVIADVTLDEIVGRAIVIHEKEDDLGMGGNEESLKTGNAGKRIACGVIAWL